mmetsp:Transcript_141/g.266  ORF Transcript_141/g.266 Transcript_141/m.266 type:complete len:153 (-) Transcript_141:5-463(-)
MAMILKYRESQKKTAAAMHPTTSDVMPFLPPSEPPIVLSPVKIARRATATALEILPKPDPNKCNAIGQQKHTIEIRSGGVIAFRVPLYQKMLVGGISGVIGLSTVFPIDLIKTRLQISNVGLSSVCHDVFAKHGVFGFYRGLGTTAVMVFRV